MFHPHSPPLTEAKSRFQLATRALPATAFLPLSQATPQFRLDPKWDLKKERPGAVGPAVYSIVRWLDPPQQKNQLPRPRQCPALPMRL